MKKIIKKAIILSLLLIACGREKTIDYRVDSNSVVQGKYKAEAFSPEKITSDYKDGFSRRASALVRYKFSINGYDNEAQPGNDHFVLIKPDEQNRYAAPVKKFGTLTSAEKQSGETEPEYLPQNSVINVIFRADMNDVFNSFREKGYYETWSGARIGKDEFDGVFISGDTEPLSWNFGEIQKNPDFEMKDPDGDGIYEVTLEFRTNDYRKLDNNGFAAWELKEDLSGFPQYTSPGMLQQALYNMSLEELLYDIRPDSAFMAGAKWHGVWTRDISYSIYLSLALIAPDVAKNSLLKKTADGRIIQDTGTGGSWPVSTDRVVWSIAAWEVYLATGDNIWLKKARDFIKNSVEADLANARDPETGLYYGESSFLDWREQSYPEWMDPRDIYVSRCLGTNVLHYRTLQILGMMYDELGENGNKYFDLASEVQKGLNSYMWLEDNGYYGQFLYGREYDYLSPRSETLGEALAVLFGVPGNMENITASLPVSQYGPPNFHPQIQGIPPYHNNAIWPFVASYYTWAAARENNAAGVTYGMEAIYRAAALFLTNKENMVAETGHFLGTEINSDRMLWSIAGNLALVYRIIFGMELTPEGLRFDPLVPAEFKGEHKLTGYKLRNAVLDITVKGSGSKIESIELDGKPLDNGSIPYNLEGKHTVSITLTEEEKPGGINLADVTFTPGSPALTLENKKIVWNKIENAVIYNVYRNGEKIKEQKETGYEALQPGEYTVIATDASGRESFIAMPVQVYDTPPVSVEPVGTGDNDYFFSGSENNYADTRFTVNADKAGEYLVDFLYANGSGPVNTFNACAIRSLFVNDSLKGTVVLPQRGEHEWEETGYSNIANVYLQKGNNELVLRYLPGNKNMNPVINDVRIHKLRFRPQSRKGGVL